MRKLLLALLPFSFILFSCISPEYAERTKIVEKPVIVHCPKVRVPHYKREKIKPTDPPEKVLEKLLNNYRICELELQQCRKALDVCSP